MNRIEGWGMSCLPKDQVFLVLAHVAKADALVTGDADILAMREVFPELIVTRDQWAGRQGVQAG
ncbi:hypothetical protein [Azotobacter vinelandii]|uniref:hypothetical protein n=1 Tax=Azotobacter vinelandii TaxID=354 RepID=UPI000773C0EF|nr:hypothetical protein [Azotobacter vinelandii]WKN24354.1 hypothetical protein AVAEIV_002519 [Azotobacter vinelandii]